MKKIKTIVTAAAMLFAVTAFATEPIRVSPVVKAAFEKDFANAEQVNWEKTSDFYFATFTLGNVSVDAAYTNDGELVGTARRITTDQVPLAVSLAIGERYAGYKIDKSAVEMNFEGQTRYYVTIANDSQVLKLKCLSNGDLDVERKTKK